MNRLDRYIMAEILGPLSLGFFVYTSILLMQALFKAAELIIRSGVDVSTVGRLLLLSLPWIVVMTIPMSFLFGILIAVGRLSSDSELIAIRASGVSLFSLYRPVFLLSLLLAGLNVYLMVKVLPDGNHALQQLRIEILTQSITEEVEPRIPHTGWQDKVLYVFDTPTGEQRWRGLFLSDAVPTRETEVTIAEWGRAEPEGDQVVLSLEGAYSHIVDLYQPEQYQLAYHNDLQVRLASLTQQRAGTSVKRSLRELSFDRLVERSKDASYPETVRNLARVEMHKKFSIPAACLVFGLLGLPLGFNNSRGGRSSGFAISIGVILIYYVLLNSGEDIAREGSLPAWLAVWFPNVLLLCLGLFLLARRNRDKSLLLANLDRWIQERFWGRVRTIQAKREETKTQKLKAVQVARAERRRKARKDGNEGATGGRVLLKLPDLRFGFPNSMDRYILQTFFRILVLAILSGTTVYLVADLTDNFDKILENEVPRNVVLDYYKFKSLSIVYEILPIIVLVTTLITFGVLSRTNEIIACKALGMSLYRLSVPVILAAMVIAGLGGLLESEVLAASNERVTELKATIKGQTIARAGGSNRRWLYGKGNRLYNFAFFDTQKEELHRLQIFQFDDEFKAITGRLMVDRAQYLDDGYWQLSSGWVRAFDGTEQTDFATFDEPRKYRLQETPEYFGGGLRLPEEMNYRELDEYITDLKQSGQDVPVLEVALYNKVAYPIISLVMALVALPFAFRLGRQGALYGIGLSLVLGVILLIVLGVFSALGENGVLPPLVAVWSPAAIFTIFSMYLFLGVRT